MAVGPQWLWAASESSRKLRYRTAGCGPRSCLHLHTRVAPDARCDRSGAAAVTRDDFESNGAAEVAFPDDAIVEAAHEVPKMSLRIGFGIRATGMAALLVAS